MAVMFIVMLLVACNKDTPVIPPLPPDQSAPNLDFQFVSMASAIKFIPFGDTLPNLSVNEGYEIQLSNTNESIVAACSGIVTSITADTAGGNFIAVKFKRNSIYSFLYGGVTNVVVHVNDSINPGSILGKINGNGINDFQLIKNNNEVLCPQAYGSAGFNTAIQEAILKNNALYPADSVLSPCVTESLPK